MRGGLACFAFEAHDVEIITKEHDCSSSSATAVYIKTKTGIQKMTTPYRDAELPEMLPLIKQGFKLMSQAHGF